MAPFRLQREFLESSRGRIIGVLRSGSLTVDEIAAELSVTGNAIRAQLATMERDGVVKRAAVRPGTTRPSRTYELTPEVDQLLSRAYIPLLTQLVRQFAAHESAAKFDRIMRQAGRGVASELARDFPAGTLATRVAAASQWLNRELGATTEVKKRDSRYVIDGRGCPLAALTGKHPGVCHAIESLLAELLEARVEECCDRTERPKCCFKVWAGARNAQTRPSRPRT
jgi:predicted ArsR family transcriptional regulator